MAEPRVYGLTVAQPKTAEGHINLALFDCELGPVIVRGAVLARMRSGKVLAILPHCRDHGRSFRFADHATQTRVTELAVAAYLAAGGALPADDA